MLRKMRYAELQKKPLRNDDIPGSLDAKAWAIECRLFTSHKIAQSIHRHYLTAAGRRYLKQHAPDQEQWWYASGGAFSDTVYVKDPDNNITHGERENLPLYIVETVAEGGIAFYGGLMYGPSKERLLNA